MQALGLAPEAATKVAAVLAADATKREAAAAAELARIKASWVDAVKADPVVGGADLEANRQVAAKALARFGDDDLKALFQETGFGDHPALVRFVVKVGKAMSEDSVAGTAGNGAASPKNDETAFLKALYPNSPELFR